jgi:4-diphosphocytidyl-2-C-methyl-D-erythritol kinase
LSKGSGRRGRLTLHAAAKVNLALEIVGRRADGYHDLVTVMQAVDLSDRLVLEEADDLEIQSRGQDLPADASNLALRAAVLLREAAGTGRGVRIALDKRIPAAAGLGGGSADAAAVLLGLNRLWRLRWPRARLHEVAVTLGMDVPFFLRGGAALATGRGEVLAPLRARALALVLVNPGVPLRTAEVYARVTPSLYSDGTRARALAGALARRGPGRLASMLVNALEPLGRAACPAVGRILAALEAAGALGAAMSGSGPTVFGLARSLDHARQIRRRLTRGSWSCWAVRALTGPAVRTVAPAVVRRG